MGSSSQSGKKNNKEYIYRVAGNKNKEDIYRVAGNKNNKDLIYRLVAKNVFLNNKRCQGLYIQGSSEKRFSE